MVNEVHKSEDVLVIIREYEEIIQTNKKYYWHSISTRQSVEKIQGKRDFLIFLFILFYFILFYFFFFLPQQNTSSN